MQQVKKGNQWDFGMKAHLGVDATTGLGHCVATTAANVADIAQVPQLLHGAETRVWGDAGYAGVARRPEHQGRAIDWQVALRPGQRRRLAPDSTAAKAERRKASIRAKVEQPFLHVKRHFGYGQVRYRGLAKNRTRLCLLFGFANLLLAERPAPGRRRPAPPLGGVPGPKRRQSHPPGTLPLPPKLWCPVVQSFPRVSGPRTPAAPSPESSRHRAGTRSARQS